MSDKNVYFNALKAKKLLTMTQRLCLLPIRPDEQDVWKIYLTQEDNSWGVNEVNLADDLKDYPLMSELEKQVFDITIARFAVADKPVVDGLVCLTDLVKPDDMVRMMMLNSQARIEGVHMHMYSKFITNIITDPEKRNKLQEAVSSYPSIKRAVDLVKAYQHEGIDERVLLLSQACAEGIGFSTSFAIAMYYKTVGKMFGFAYGNSKVMQDEHIHYQHACEWLSHFDELDDDVFNDVVKAYVDVEVQFANEAFGDQSLGILNAQSLAEYARQIANLLCINCNKPPLYKELPNPLPYMDMTSLKSKTNFFERNVPDYKKLSAEDALLELEIDATQIV